MTSELSISFSVVIHVEGLKAQTITAPTMQEAGKNFRDYFEMNDLGASSMHGDCGKLYRTVDGKQEHIGRISYNGRLWDLLGNEIQLPSADEAKAEQIEAVAIRDNPKIPLLARVFSRVLQEWLMPAEMNQAIARNETAEYKGACATHDFCDANMAMHEAFENLGLKGISDFETDSPEQVAAMALWNKAWDYAKANRFFVSVPVGERHREVVRLATDAFWAEVKKHFSAATHGDLDPMLVHAFETAAIAAVEGWVENNVPPTGEEQATSEATS
jgi:hypothetical protein